MHVLQPDLALGGHPHVRDHGPSLDRVVADEVGHGAQRRGQRVAEISEAFPLEEGNAPAVDVVPRAPAALAEASERETKVCRRVRLVRKERGICVYIMCACRWNAAGNGSANELTVRPLAKFICTPYLANRITRAAVYVTWP